jgi:hypothetical protein
MTYMDFCPGMSFGTGIDGLTGNVLGNGFEPAESEIGAEGQTVVYSINKIETYEQVQQVMGIPVEGDLSYRLFNASDKANYSQLSNISAYGLYLLVSIVVQNSADTPIRYTADDEGREATR